MARTGTHALSDGLQPKLSCLGLSQSVDLFQKESGPFILTIWSGESVFYLPTRLGISGTMHMDSIHLESSSFGLAPFMLFLQANRKQQVLSKFMYGVYFSLFLANDQTTFTLFQVHMTCLFLVFVAWINILLERNRRMPFIGFEGPFSGWLVGPKSLLYLVLLPFLYFNFEKRSEKSIKYGFGTNEDWFNFFPFCRFFGSSDLWFHLFESTIPILGDLATVFRRRWNRLADY